MRDYFENNIFLVTHRTGAPARRYGRAQALLLHKSAGEPPPLPHMGAVELPHVARMLSL
jgi:hypothetical protein